MSNPGPGWYDDTTRPGQQRYWDGQAWTEHNRPRADGFPPPAYAAQESAPGATASLVLGILSLVACGLLTGIPAMIMGRKATRAVDESQGRLGGRGIAQAGFVTGLIGTLLTTLGLVAVLGVFALGGVVQNSFDESCSIVTPGPDATTVDCG